MKKTKEEKLPNKRAMNAFIKFLEGVNPNELDGEYLLFKYE